MIVDDRGHNRVRHGYQRWDQIDQWSSVLYTRLVVYQGGGLAEVQIDTSLTT